MVDSKNKNLSISRQCGLLGISRGKYYYKGIINKIKQQEKEVFKSFIVQTYFKFPFYGHRRIDVYLKSIGIASSREKVKRAMKELGLKAIHPGPNTSKACKEHKKYPYLLRGLKITHKNQVWASDITYIKLNGSFMYLVAIIDLYSRKVLSWRLSNTLDSYFCCECVNEAVKLFGAPEIFNTDQGSQFTCNDFVVLLKSLNIGISMDGKGRALDNVYIERVWRTLKYENIYLHDYETVKKLKKGIDSRALDNVYIERVWRTLKYEKTYISMIMKL